MFSWAAAKLFVDGLKAAGQNPTRPAVIAALKNIHTFDDNGMVAQADVGNKKPPDCWMLFQVKDAKFQRMLPADKGYTCSPSGYFNASQ
jgi:hypothetical protein